MRHNYIVEGIAFRLRPVEDSDAAFIVSLRSERGEFFQKGAENEREQLLWQREYYDRPNDYYFIVEKKNGSPVGVIAAYDIDLDKKEAAFGRWLIVKSSSAAVESAWLIYRFIFEYLNLSRAYTLTVDENKKVVSFHESCGSGRAGVLSCKYFINGRYVNAVVQEVTADMWNDVSARLESLAARMGKK